VHVSEWREVASEIFVRAYEHLEINICVIRDGDDLLLVDTRSSPVEAAELEADLQVFAPARVRTLVNTHAHFDHTFGNQQFGPGNAYDVPIYGHHLLPAHLERYERPRLAAWHEGTGGEPDRAWQDLRITGPTRLVSDTEPVRVGDRTVILHALGPGHTDTDLVLHVPDAHTWIVGDVVEASGPPMYGSGCFPLELPGQLAFLLGEVERADLVVPGHGPVVDRAFVESQHDETEALARQIRWVRGRGDTVEQALSDQDRWPFPVEGLELAVRRGYLALDATARSGLDPRA
jgi:glyoxylase-like metal-dependent hydrolase (beta-lactamase superfamily II)